MIVLLLKHQSLSLWFSNLYLQAWSISWASGQCIHLSYWEFYIDVSHTLQIQHTPNGKLHLTPCATPACFSSSIIVSERGTTICQLLFILDAFLFTLSSFNQISRYDLVSFASSFYSCCHYLYISYHYLSFPIISFLKYCNALLISISILASSLVHFQALLSIPSGPSLMHFKSGHFHD